MSAKDIDVLISYADLQHYCNLLTWLFVIFNNLVSHTSCNANYLQYRFYTESSLLPAGSINTVIFNIGNTRVYT